MPMNVALVEVLDVSVVSERIYVEVGRIAEFPALQPKGERFLHELNLHQGCSCHSLTADYRIVNLIGSLRGKFLRILPLHLVT